MDICSGFIGFALFSPVGLEMLPSYVLSQQISKVLQGGSTCYFIRIDRAGTSQGIVFEGFSVPKIGQINFEARTWGYESVFFHITRGWLGN